MHGPGDTERLENARARTLPVEFGGRDLTGVQVWEERMLMSLSSSTSASPSLEKSHLFLEFTVEGNVDICRDDPLDVGLIR